MYSFRAIRAALVVFSLAGAGQLAAARERGAALDAAVATITVPELREHAATLADDTLEGREAGSRGGKAAARYLETRLQAAGLQPAGDGGGFVQRFSPNYQNLLGVVRGADPTLAAKYLLVGAHFDHVGYGTRRNSNGPVGYIHNGADDNASGVAALLEVIDALSHSGWQPRRSIVFAFWDGEEKNLLGSRHWVRQPTVPLADVQLAINIDMVGRMTGDRLEVAGTRTGVGLRQLLSSSRLPPKLRLDFTWEYTDNSDHWPLFEAGVPSLLLHTGLHDDYHRPSDDLEKLNVAGIQMASAYLLEAICGLADADTLPAFRAAARSENQLLRRQREAPRAAAPPRLGLAWASTQVGGKTALRISRISAGSPAEQAGLRVDDHIIAVDGHGVVDEALLPAAVLRAEKEISLEIVRDGAKPQAVLVSLAGGPVALGLSWREDSAAPGAVFVTQVVPYSPAGRAGVTLDDRIYAIDGEPFADQDALLRQVQQRIAAGAASIQLKIETAGRVRTIDVDLGLPIEVEDPSS